MKFRNGFVSNSSSSSFIAIMTPKATKNEIMRKIELTENSPHMFKTIIDCFWNKINNNKISNMNEFLLYLQDYYDKNKKTIDEFFVEDDWNDGKIKGLTLDEYNKIFNDGKTINIGSFSTDCSPEEYILCEYGFNFKTENIDFKIEGF